jgi:hypothetical protein
MSAFDRSVPQPRRGQYARVSTADDDDGGGGGGGGGGGTGGPHATEQLTERQRRRLKREAREAERAGKMEAVQTKIYAVFWTAAMLAVLYYTDFFRVCLTSTLVNRFWFNLSLVCWGVDAAAMMYLGCYLPYKGITLEWNVYCPRVIPTASAAMALGSLTLMFGLWPVWGFVTPFILGISGIGFLMSLHFVPACSCCP